jgi:coenzyme F420-reducing hydrogenase alpha subunit
MRCTSSTSPAPTCCSASTPSRRSATSSPWHAAHPDIAKKGILLRKYGQEVIRITAGKRVHGTGCGARRREQAGHLAARRATMPLKLQTLPRSMLEPGRKTAVDIAKQPARAKPGALQPALAAFRSNLLSLVRRADGALDLYDGVLRVRDADGKILFDGVSDQRYLDLIEEEVRSWSYMKFPTCAAGAATTAGTAWGRWRGCRTATSSHAACRGRAPGLRERLGPGRLVHAALAYALGAHDRDAACGRSHRRAAGRPGPAAPATWSATGPRRAARAWASSRRRAAR